jgi:hypothetical protein
LELAANPDVVITFTVSRYLSVTQGTMLTKGANPDVTTDLVLDAAGRVSRPNNGSFEATGSDPQGNNPFVVQIEVLPANAYAVKDLIIRNVHNINEGGVAWDDVRVGEGLNDNKVTLKDRGRKPVNVASIAYELYLLIKPKQAPADFPVGDVGLIDPLWTNR